ncbi:choice-of-anchor L domain-containing protein, partial [Maribacter confluentis]
MKISIISVLKSLAFLLLLLVCHHSFGQTIFTSGANNTTLLNQLDGPGVILSNATLEAGNRATQIGIFSNAISGGNFEIDEGVVLSTGSVDQAFRANSETQSTINAPGVTQYNDSDIVNINPNANYDVVVFSFDVVLEPGYQDLLVNFQFGSDEYPDYVGSQFNDIFGLFVTGPGITGSVNIANVPGSGNPVAVNSINAGFLGCQDDATAEDLTQSALYINNGHNTNGAICNTNPGPFTVTTEYNGLTNQLRGTILSLVPGSVYRFKVAIADTADASLDSAVFMNIISASLSITANDDNGTSIKGVEGAAVNNVLANDEYGINTPNLSDVIISQISTTNPGVTINTSTGEVNVSSAVPVGTYELVYQICDVANSSSCSTASVFIYVLEDTDGDGVADADDMDDDNDGILDTVECTNLLLQGGFENLTGLSNGNNIGVDIAPWVLGGGNQANVVQVDGAGGFDYGNGGPFEDANPETGSGVSQRYLDIAGGSNDFYQSFVIDGTAEITFSGYFSARDNLSGNGSISILSGVGIAGTLIDGSGTLVINSDGDSQNKPWTYFEKIITLPAGTYSFVVSMDENLNFDEGRVKNCFDTDADGVPDYLDLDSDNDGIYDAIEAGHGQTQTSGKVDGAVGADGVPNAVQDGGLEDSSTVNYIVVDSEATPDNIPDYLDLDADNDGIPDNVEAQTTAGYVTPNTDDSATYIVNNGVNSAYLGGLIPENTDGTDVPDYLDLDSDNEGGNDTAEAGLTLANSDSDSDGLDDNIDTSADYSDPNGSINDPTALPNTQNTTTPEVDYRDESPAAIVANDDATPADLTAVNGFTGGDAGDVTTNDLLNGVSVDDNDINITITDIDGLTGVTIAADGTITVPAGTAARTYNVEYSICEKLNTSNCNTAIATIVVEAAAIVAN